MAEYMGNYFKRKSYNNRLINESNQYSKLERYFIAKFD